MITPPSDIELLAAYSQHGGQEQAFREFVQRHAAWILGVATRSVGQPALGEEIAQAVFCLAAQRAGDLASGKVVVAAWLHRTTLLTAANAARSERRYQQRLQRFAAELPPQLNMTPDESSRYQEMLPHLDQALDALPTADRAMLLQRYFENRNIAHIARCVGISEDACQKRLSRALDKLAHMLKRKQVAISSVMLDSFLRQPTAHASAECVRKFANTALLVPAGKVTLAGFAVAAPLVASTLTTLLTAAAAIIALAVPVGLQLRENASAPLALVGSVAVPKRSVVKAIDPLLAKLSAAVSALHEDDPEALLELVIFICNLPADKLPGAWEILRGSGEVPHTLVRSLFSRWTELDLQGAVAASALTESNSLLCSVWHGIASIWAVRDPQAFFAEVAKFPRKDSALPWQEIAHWHGLTKLANARPDVALTFAKSLPKEKQKQVTELALSLWGQRDPAAAIRHLQATRQDQEFDEVLHTMAEQVAYHQPAVAFQIASQQVNPHLREEATCFALQQWGADDPKAAAKALATVPQEIQTDSLAQIVTRSLVVGAEHEMMEIARKADPGEYRQGILDTMAMYYSNDPAARSMEQVLELALLMAPGQHKDFNFEHAAKTWLKETPEAARAWLLARDQFPEELKSRLLK